MIMKMILRCRLAFVILACICATLLINNGVAQAATKTITAHIVMDSQLGTTKIEDDANANVHVILDGLEDNPDQNAPGAEFTYSWSLISTGLPATLPDVNAPANTLSTTFDTAGEYHLQFKVDIDFDPGTGDDKWHGTATKEISQSVIGGDFTITGDKTLYYFCGAPVGVGEKQTVSAPQQPEGTTWNWNTSTALTVEENNDTPQPDGEVKGVAGSTNKGWDWVQISYSLNGVTWTSPMHSSYSVLTPSSLTKLSTQNGSNPNFGSPGTTPQLYLSQIEWQVRDQFGDSLSNVPLNETFGTFTASPSHPDENWGAPTPYPATTNSSGTFFDSYYVWQVDQVTGVEKIPPIQYTDPNNLSQDLVTSGPQSYYIGSSTFGQGCLLNTGMLSYYVDHAAHK